MTDDSITIRYDGGSFQSRDLLLIDRAPNGDVMVHLADQEPKVFKGDEARSVWGQVTEHSETIETIEIDREGTY